MVARVGAKVFLPRPRVESALVSLTRRPVDDDLDTETFDRIVNTAFSGRRKMLRRSLQGVLTAEEIASAGIEPTSRPEQLPLEAWLELTNSVVR